MAAEGTSDALPAPPGAPPAEGWFDKAESYLAQYFGSATEVAELFADVVAPLKSWEAREAHPAFTSIRPRDASLDHRASPSGLHDRLDALPLDALYQILNHCCARTLVSAAQASRALYEAVNCDGHWRSLWQQRYGALCSSLGLDACPRPAESWRSFYFSFGTTWAMRAHTEKGLVIIKVDGAWHDATPMLADHPGGPALLLASAGLDATNAFDYTGHSVRCTSTVPRPVPPPFAFFPPRFLCPARPATS
jgi:hypothetical protein